VNNLTLLKRITVIITLHTLNNKLVATCCVERAAQHLRHSTYDFFIYENAWAR